MLEYDMIRDSDSKRERIGQKGSVIGYAVILYTCYIWNGEL